MGFLRDSGQGSAVRGQLSAVSFQPSAVAQALALAKRPRGARLATLCERRWDLTQIKAMLTGCLDAVAHGGNHGSCSWGRPPLAALPPQDRAASLIQMLFA
ncbi:hypothetical protein [Moorena sp. SIO4G3]|uniref:hypothetical protein n=1 Tax=Moorena sp. SIO4G3 TaxID=2607821 RepID=UPI00142A28AF|nr:hypothetical protein [Moorena sp. SIO4G3]NEO78538.1 hypothetical protein [Moorena sp. SIO4G3]